MVDRCSDRDKCHDDVHQQEVSEIVKNIDDFLETVRAKDDQVSNKIPEKHETTHVPPKDSETLLKNTPLITFNTARRLQSSRDKSHVAEDVGNSEQTETFSNQSHYDNLPVAGSREKLSSSNKMQNMKKLEAKSSDLSSSSTQKSRATTQNKKTAFPQVLHLLLETAEENGFRDIVSWQNHGRSFRVKDKKQFATKIMPIYFDQTQYKSFQRQLALYGFVRLTKKNSSDYGSYYHESFLRGYPDTCRTIQRKAIKGSRYQKSALAEAEPDFQTMKPVGIQCNVEYQINDNEQQLSRDKQCIIAEKDLEMDFTNDVKPSIKARKSYDHENTLEDSEYDSTSMDEDDTIDNLSMAEFLSDVDL